ncbi:Hypothetical protein ABZS17G119_04292 (plasmid) [Kosakonia cowanii]
MLPYITGPCGDEPLKFHWLTGKKRPRCFFKSGQITRDSKHEVVGPFERLANFFFIAVGSSCFLDQLSQRH